MNSLEFFSSALGKQRAGRGTFLFNQQEHLFLQSKRGWRVYELRHQETEILVARIFFNIEKKNAVSPFRAPFGSLEVYENLTQKNIEELFCEIERELKESKVTHWHIKHYPDAYQPITTRLLRDSLTHLGFNHREELSAVITVDHKSFEKKIRIAQRQKLRKSEKRFVFHGSKIIELKKAYNFINACREERGQPLSMTFAQLQKVVKVFPNDFLVFQVLNERQIVASAIVIKINNRILYTFYYAHDKKYNKISPVVFLISGIYKYAYEHQFSCIDLGTSMVNGGVNKSLMHFKKSIGGKSCVKYIFEKTL